MKYIGNAFSIGMLDMPDARLKVTQITPEEVRRALVDFEGPWKSCVGHEDTARLFSEQLNLKIEKRRESTSLQIGDDLFVGQYNGPRLPEGATSLPEGAKIRWYRVQVCAGKLAAELTEEEARELYYGTPW